MTTILKIFEVGLDFILTVFKKTVFYGLLTVLVILSILVTFVYVITSIVS